MGGGSAEVTPPYVVTPLEGLRAALAPAGVDVMHEVGCIPAGEFIVLEGDFEAATVDKTGAAGAQ